MGCVIYWDQCCRDSGCCSTNGLCALGWFNSFQLIHLKESRRTGLRMRRCPKHQVEEDNSSKAAWPELPPHFTGFLDTPLPPAAREEQEQGLTCGSLPQVHCMWDSAPRAKPSCGLISSSESLLGEDGWLKVGLQEEKAIWDLIYPTAPSFPITAWTFRAKNSGRFLPHGVSSTP